ncbi:MAG: virulence factor [Woeseiaceae bacterium]
MVKMILVYWRDIPSQVIVQRGRDREKLMLSQRFQRAIDSAAMRAGKGSSDAYLADWRRETIRREDDGDLGDVARREAARLEAELGEEQLRAMVRNHGNAVPAESAGAVGQRGEHR